jgi:3',5'-cyclic AMP phosphodiesterase CpdA
MDDHDRPSTTSRRNALKCAGWFGTGMIWAVVGGVPRTIGLIGTAEAEEYGTSNFTFVQMSDPHIGFKAGRYHDVNAALTGAIAQVKAMPKQPKFMLQTGDISHLAKADEFATADQIYSTLGLDIYHVPGEHDMLDPGKKLYLARYGKNTLGDGWYSFDENGVHFIALINVVHSTPDGQWQLGADQLSWLADDLRGVSPSTPIVVFAHIPLWDVYAKWGWSTADAPAAMPLFRRFGSVTFLNGHIHQIVQKVEGNMSFHTARSTAFPQPVAGTAPHEGPILTIPAGEVGEYLGISTIAYRRHHERLAITDITLA